MANDKHYRLDNRTGLGYGVLEPQFHKPQNIYQYPKDREEFEPPEMEQENFINFRKKTQNPRSFDSGPQRSKDHLYLEGDTFLSPIPDLYKNRDAHFGTKPLPFGGPSTGFRSAGKSTGERRGWNYNPSEQEVDEDEHIYSLEQLALKQLREYVRLKIMDLL